MGLSRRRFLKLGVVAGAGLALPLGTLSAPAGRLVASASVRSPGVERFQVPLPIPPVARPVHTHDGADRYEITQRVARQEILPGLKTEVWGYDGVFPGPTIEARRDRPVVIRQINELPVPVSVHLHGGKTPPGSDGYPNDLILPNGGDQAHPNHPPGTHAPEGAATGGKRSTATPTRSARPPSGTTTTAWTSRVPRSTGASRACTSCATGPRTRCRCRGAKRTCRS